MKLDMRTATSRENYKAIAGCVVPRPVAWITTVSESGVVNLAPYSFFSPMSTRPPILGISMSPRADGTPKDSFHNIAATKELVVNIAGSELVAEVHQSGVDYAPDVSEVEALGLELIPSETVSVPRLAKARASFECRYMYSLDFAPGPRWIVVEPLLAHFDDNFVDENLHVDYESYRPLGRLIADGYVINPEFVRPARDWSVPRYGDMKIDLPRLTVRESGRR